MQSLFSPRPIHSRRRVASSELANSRTRRPRVGKYLSSSADVDTTDGIAIVRRFTRARAAAETRRER